MGGRPDILYTLLPPHIKLNPDIALAAIQDNINAFQEVTLELQQNTDFIHKVITNIHPNLIPRILQEIAETPIDKKTALFAIKENEESIDHLPMTLRREIAENIPNGHLYLSTSPIRDFCEYAEGRQTTTYTRQYSVEDIKQYLQQEIEKSTTNTTWQERVDISSPEQDNRYNLCPVL